MSAPLTKAALSEVIREGWHEAGLYGRADLSPDWLNALASMTADALLGSDLLSGQSRADSGCADPSCRGARCGR